LLVKENWAIVVDSNRCVCYRRAFMVGQVPLIPRSFWWRYWAPTEEACALA